MSPLSVRSIGVVLDTALDVTSHEHTCSRILQLAEEKRPAYVCFATAHMVIEANRRNDIKLAYRDAAIVNPDGRPLAWALRMLGHTSARCVSGPNHTPFLLREAERRGTTVGFYGGRPETLLRMQSVLTDTYPRLRIVYAYSPPFRTLDSSESAAISAAIGSSGVNLLFVGLGSIKQELWMHENYASLPCVCLGVGAVFEILSGEQELPPLWVQNIGMTWFTRLLKEPRRLFRRNLYSPIFAIMFFLQLVTAVCWRMLGISRPGNMLIEGDLR